MNKDYLTKICQRIDCYQSESIKLEEKLVAIPALAPENGGEGEQKKSDFLLNYLESELKCDEVKIFNAPDDRVPTGHRPNFIAIFKGKNQTKTIWIMSHMDVVPPGDLNNWHSDPWKIRVEHGKIFGRGTEDNHQGIVSSLLCLKAFREESIQPENNIGLVLVSDEETGNEYGIQYVLENHKDLFNENDFIIIPDAGIEDSSMIEVAEKSILWFKFRVIGKQTHASTPDHGINALKAGAELIVKLDKLYALYDASDPVFDPPTSTFEPTKKESNVPNINTIPGEDIFYMDCRVLPEYKTNQLKADVNKICKEVEIKQKVSIEVTYEHEISAAPSTPIDAPVVKSLERAIIDICGIQPKSMGIGGGTVAAYFRNEGFNTVVWATLDETAHESNEYAKIENILKDAKVFAHLGLQR